MEKLEILLKNLEDKYDEYNKKYNEKQKELEFYDEYFNGDFTVDGCLFKYDKCDDFIEQVALSYSYVEIISKAYLNARIPELSLDQIDSDVKSFIEILFRADDYDYNDGAMDFVLNLKRNNKVDKFKKTFANYRALSKKMISEGKLEELKNLFNPMLSPLSVDLIIAAKTFNTLNFEGYDLDRFIDYFDYTDGDHHIIGDLLYLIYLLFNVSRYKSHVAKTVEASSAFFDLNKKRQKQSFNMSYSFGFKLTYGECDIPGKLKIIGDYYDKLRDENKKLFKRERLYAKLLEDIPSLFKEDEIRDYKKILDKIPAEEEELRLEFISLVYQHNEKYYKELDKEHKSLSENSESRYIALLNDYGISKESVMISLVMRNSYDDVSTMLQTLAILNNKDLIKYALVVSNLKHVSELANLLNKGILVEKTLELYTDLFIPNSDSYRTLINRMDELEPIHFNMANFANEPEIVFENPYLKQNIAILEKYQLIKGLTSGKASYQFLMEPDLSTKIDTILELGLEKLLLADLAFLNENHFDRLQVLSMMNNDINSFEDEEIFNYLRDDNFFISDDMIQGYLYTPQFSECDVTEVESIPELDPYIDIMNPRVYVINGVKISINRVLRNFPIGLEREKAIEYALFHGCKLSLADVQAVKEEIKGNVFHK